MPAAALAARPLSARQILAESWAVWSRNALPILSVALLLTLPRIPATVSKAEPSSPGRALLALLVSLAGIVGALAQVGAVTLSAQRALRGEALLIPTLLVQGLRRTWLILKVLFLSMWWIALAMLALFLLARPWVVRALGGSISPEARLWLLTGSFSVASLVATTLYFPAYPVAIASPDRGACHAVRRARELTEGVRARLFGVALLLGCLAIPTSVLYHWAYKLPLGGARTMALLAYAAVGAVAASFALVVQVIVQRALCRVKQGTDADVEDLARVFE